MVRLKKQLLAVIAACLLALLFSVVPTAAETTAKENPVLNYDVYLKLDGITGDVAAKGYEKWIQLAGVEFDVANSISSASSGSGSGSGKTSLKEFVITKQVDSASVPIFLDAATGKAIKTGQLVFVTRGDHAAPLLTIDLSTVHIADYSFNNALETITINVNSLELKYVSQSKTGSKNPPITGSWNFSENKK
ncbi:Hcp family type VI secretion system effector [Paenibacillus sp. SI8]|uniref:Hcp family type VI secretion system effector n=1 Tax=unclassified Paenibacillus TaxID=185978 RepID=UPI0034665BDD